jgi:hypothetical protein
MLEPASGAKGNELVMSSPTPPDLPAETRAPATKIKPLVWILVGIGLLLVCATLGVGFLAVRAVKNAGFAFRFDPAKKTLVLIGRDGKEVKISPTGDGGHPLGGAEQKVLVAWLAQHPEYRAALDADCACDELLRLNPGAHPYTATGDFTHDGKTDFAAAVIDKQTGKFALLIFNGPIGSDPVKPALFLMDLDLRRQGLFFGLSFEEPPRLYLGYYNSDDFRRFVPAGNTYVLEDVLPDAPPDTTSATLSNSAAEPLLVENRHVERKLPGCGEWGPDGCDHVEFTYVEVVGGPAVARDRINAAVAACLQTAAGDSRKLTPESFAQNYIDHSASFYKDHPSERPSFLTLRVEVLRNAACVFTLRCDNSSFSGGLHPMSSSKYLNFDPVTGEPIKLGSILKDGAMVRLTEIAEVHFRQARKLAATARLDEEGFGGLGFGWPDGRFALNGNYGFGEKALYFFFNDYEIAPHAMGTTLVEIPYAEIRDLIRPEFPL